LANDVVLSARVSKDEARQLEGFAKQQHLDKSAFIKKLLHESLDEYKVKQAFDLFKQKKISFGKAAEIAGKSLAEMIELMKKYDAYLNYSVDDLKEDLKNLEGI